MGFYEENILEGSVQCKHRLGIQVGMVLSEEKGIETACNSVKYSIILAGIFTVNCKPPFL